MDLTPEDEELYERATSAGNAAADEERPTPEEEDLDDDTPDA